MASFPNSIYVPREVENKEGTVYDPDLLTRVFAEDKLDSDAEIVAIENFLNPSALIRRIRASFQSLDGFSVFATGSGSRAVNFPVMRVFTGATNGSHSVVYAQSNAIVGFDASKSFRFRCIAKLSSNTANSGRFGIGALGGGDGFSGAGFRFEDGSLYAYIEDDQSVTSSDAISATLTDDHLYEIRHVAGSNDYLFYVDGVLSASINHSFSEPLDDFLFVMRILNSASATKSLYLSDFEYDLSL